MNKPLRIGIAGLGRIFDLNCLGYIGNPDTTIVGLCDIRPDLVAERLKVFPEAKGFQSYDDLLDLDLDLMEILSPHPLHRDMAAAAFSRGAHVSVQKPMAMTLAECDAMIDAAEMADRRLKIFENFLFYPALVKARELLLSGAIGEPKHFRMKVLMGSNATGWHVPAASNAWRDDLTTESRGGPLVFDHGHHMMAVALWLFGDVKDCYAQIEHTPVPDGFTQDAPATLIWRHQKPPIHAMWDVSLALQMRVRTDYYASHERFEIQGESGIITVARCSDRLLDEPVLTLYRDGEVRAWHNIEDDWGESFRLSTLHFLDVLKGREPQQVLTGPEGRRVISLFDSLHRSSQEGRRIECGEPRV